LHSLPEALGEALSGDALPRTSNCIAVEPACQAAGHGLARTPGDVLGGRPAGRLRPAGRHWRTPTSTTATRGIFVVVIYIDCVLFADKSLEIIAQSFDLNSRGFNRCIIYVQSPIPSLELTANQIKFIVDRLSVYLGVEPNGSSIATYPRNRRSKTERPRFNGGHLIGQLAKRFGARDAKTY
jgi:hypothetical protein